MQDTLNKEIDMEKEKWGKNYQYIMELGKMIWRVEVGLSGRQKNNVLYTKQKEEKKKINKNQSSTKWWSKKKKLKKKKI